MKIKYMEIQNFRRLKNCKIELGDKNTLFVGANNSGKTSAMNALVKFLTKTKTSMFTINDFTVSNWNTIIDIGKILLKEELKEDEKKKITLSAWQKIIPSLDVWIEARNDINLLRTVIPTLEWENKLIGVRMNLEPIDLNKLYKDFLKALRAAETIRADKDNSEKYSSEEINLWPVNLLDFLERKLDKYFAVTYYTLDPDLIDKVKDIPQELSDMALPKKHNPLKGIIKVNLIPAQRDFLNSDFDSNANNKKGKLSEQLQEYYKEHLDPEKIPTKNDKEAILAIRKAEKTFDDKLVAGFENAIKELETLGYPGVANPQITISTKLSLIDGLDHKSAVKYSLTNDGTLELPEKYNGLGYQNLISMV